MSELARRGQSRLDKETARKVAEARSDEVIERAKVEAKENVAAYEVSVRMANGYALTAQAQQHLTSLNAYPMRVAKDNPGLEMGLREFETIYTLGAGQLIYNYLNRPRRG